MKWEVVKSCGATPNKNADETKDAGPRQRRHRLNLRGNIVGRHLSPTNEGDDVWWCFQTSHEQLLSYYPSYSSEVGVFLRVLKHIVLLLFVRHCVFVLFWSWIVVCLLFLLFHVIRSPVLTERTRSRVCRIAKYEMFGRFTKAEFLVNTNTSQVTVEVNP